MRKGMFVLNVLNSPLATEVSFSSTLKNLCCGKLKLLCIPRYKYQTQGKAHNTTRTEATT